MPEFGNIGGLAVNMGYDQRVNDLRYQQQMMKQQDALNDAKRRMFESDIEYQQGGNAFDQPIVKKVNQQITQQIGDYVADNPDWDTNFQKRAYVKQLKNSLKDNPDVLRALSTNENRNALLKYAQEAKQKGVPFDEDKLNEELMRYQNYEKFGNPDGPEALQNEGMKAYLFERPQDWADMTVVYKDAGASIKNPEFVETGHGGYYTKPKDADAEARTNSILQRYGNQLTKQFAKDGITDPNEIKKAVKQNVIASFDSDFKLGDELGYWRAAMEQKKLNMDAKDHAAKEAAGKSPNYTNWEYFADLTANGKDAGINKAGILDAKLYNEVWGGTQNVKITGTDGRKVDLSDQEFKPKGRYLNIKGATFIPGYIDMPLDVAESKGIYKQGVTTWDGIRSEFKNSAEEVVLTNKDGSTQKAIRVNYELPINRYDPVARSKFNIATNTAKNVNPTQEGMGEVNYGASQMIKIGGYDIPVGSRVTNKKTGKVGILQADGTVK